jgi:hypothetical protein
MARYANKTCEQCGYKTHRLYQLPDWGYYEGLCADCTLDMMRDPNTPEDERPTIDDVEDEEDGDEG